ncbi:MAG: energy-coupling factor transporter transmembrane component T, partial [Actinomycetota bacterium]
VVLRTTLVVFGPVTLERLAYAALEGLRLAMILVVFGAFNAVADPFGVLRLAPRRMHEPALAAALALSIAPRTVAAVGRVREAQAMRGIRVHGARSLPALAVPVLETGMEDAMVLAESMDARGHGRGRRTTYRPTRWDVRSVAAASISAAAASAFVAAAITGRGDLVPSTAPLLMPDASIALVLAAASFAAPAFLARREP